MTDRLRLDKDDHEPWLKYPDPNKQHRPFYSTHKHQNHHSTSSYHGHHSRSSLAGTTPPVPGLLHHKRSSSRLAQQQHHHPDVNSPSSLSSNSNSSSDSLGQWPHPTALTSTTTATTTSAASLHHQQQQQQQQQHQLQQHPQPQQPLQSSSKPRSLSDELSFALSQDNQSSSASSNSLRPSPISPSDILGIPDRSSLRPDSPSLRRLQRSSPLSLSLDTHSNGDSDASPHQQQTPAPSVSFSSPAYSSFSSGGSTTASEEPLSPRVGLPPPAPLAAALSLPSPSSASLLLSTTQRQQQQQQQQTVPRLSHSLSLSSSSSVSSSSSTASTSSSTPSSPSSSTAPCSALCRHSQSRHSYTDRHHPSPSSSSSQHLRHHPACIHSTGHGLSTHVRRTHSVHRNPRHHNHHPSCPQTSLSHGNGSELSPFGKHAPEDFAATGAVASSPSSERHAIAADQDVSITTSPLTLLPVQQQDDVQMHDQKEVVSRSLSREDDIPFPDDILLLEKASPSTAVTVVDTKAYGIQAYKALRDRDLYEQHPYLGEPPKKKMRSTAAMLFGAAVETVIFTGAVALSAYQLLTGKGRQASQLQEVAVETETTPADTSSTPDDVLAQSEAPEPAKPLMIESAPVNIPSSRSLHHRHSGHFKRSPQVAGSLHHSQYVHGHHRHHHHHHHHPHHNHSNSHRKSSSRRQGGLVSSLPHASHMSAAVRSEDPYSQSRQPTRPNTGTEDNDEQFLRMEAQLSTLIAEGKRALGSEIPDWRKFPTGPTIY